MTERGILMTAQNRLAIEEDRKTMTRRLSGLQKVNVDPSRWKFSHEYYNPLTFIFDDLHDTAEQCRAEMRGSKIAYVEAVFELGDRLYVKRNYFTKKADATLWLEVTAARVERLQEISEEDAIAEGCRHHESAIMSMAIGYRASFKELWDSINTNPKPVKKKGVITHYISYPWEDIQATREHRGKSWHIVSNPWVEVVTFKRIAKP